MRKCGQKFLQACKYVTVLGITPLPGKPAWMRVIRILKGAQGQGVVSRLDQGDHRTVTTKQFSV